MVVAETSTEKHSSSEMPHIIPLVLIPLLLLHQREHFALAASFTFIGNVDGNWSNVANWDSLTLPAWFGSYLSPYCTQSL